MVYATFTIGIDESWIDDGYNFSAEGVYEAMMDAIPYALEHEIEVYEVALCKAQSQSKRS